MQRLLFNQDVTADQLELLPASMRSPSGWMQPDGKTMCSWCGIRPHDIRPDGYVLTRNGRTESTWKDPDSTISWGVEDGVLEAVERICPFCVHRPTDLQRAIEVAKLVAAAKEAA
jgi:hypothetical protein